MKVISGMFAKIIKILIRTGYFPKSILIFAALLLSAVLDIAVISLTAPIIFYSLGGASENSLDTFGILNDIGNMVSLEVIAVTALLTKIIYQLLTFKWIYRTAFNIFFDISLEMLRGVFADQGNNITASKLSVSITSELEEFVKTVVLPFFQMLSEITLVIFVLIYLATVNLILTISFIIFCIILLLLYRFSISHKLNDLGLITRSTRLQLIENAQFIAMHKQEIQSLNAVGYFFDQISEIILKFSITSARYQFFLSLPRLVIELLGLLALLILGIFAPLLDIEGVILIIFGVATLRMLPALQRIYVSFTQIKFGERTIHFVNSIETFLKDSTPNEFTETISIDAVIKTKHGFNLKMTKNDQLHLASFVYGMNFIIGKSGSGKTTVMNSLFNHLQNLPTYITCSVMQQSTTVFPGSVFDNIVLSRDFDEDRLKELINILFKAETGRLAPEQILSIALGDLGKGLSGGQVQRIALLRTLLLHRDVYLIDEGLASLNPELRTQVIIDIDNWLIKNNSIAIIVTHETENLSQYPVLEIK